MIKEMVSIVCHEDEIKKIVQRCKRVGYNIDIMRQSACLGKPIVTGRLVRSCFTLAGPTVAQ